jgi:hypothetical protein
MKLAQPIHLQANMGDYHMRAVPPNGFGTRGMAIAGGVPRDTRRYVMTLLSMSAWSFGARRYSEAMEIGAPYGNRTRLYNVKGCRPNR